MGDTYAISGLRRKHARIAGEIESAERALERKRRDLAIVDATLELFAPGGRPDLIPAIHPTRHGMFFRRGEQVRLCLRALRETDRPLTVRQITVYAMAAKGLPTDNGPVVTLLTRQVRGALLRLERKGWAVKVLEEPHAWWAVAPEGEAGAD